MSIPTIYLDDEGNPPPKLDVDVAAIFALARGLWHRKGKRGLSRKMRHAMTSARVPEPSAAKALLAFNVRLDTAKALEARGMVKRSRGKAGARIWPLTVLGLLVREAGTRTPTSAGES